ncbi:MAG: PilW family protein [Halofilum sp. (in: g-proteobacteria)]
MHSNNRQRGFSLIELMIAMTIGLILLAAVIALVTNSSRTQRHVEQVGEQIENGRYALDLLRREVQHAGYYGEYYDVRAPSNSSDPPPDPCTTDPDQIEEDIGLPIQGYDSVNGDPDPSCLSDDDHRDGTDILVLRRASTSKTDVADLTSGELYIQSLSINKIIEIAGGSDNESTFDLEKLDNTRANIRKLRTDIYFIGPDGNDVPTLKRLSLVDDGGDLTWREEPLATGVENMQIEYGVDSDGNGTAHDYETDPGTVGDWADVIALRVHLVVRTRDASEGYTDTKTYDVGLEGTYDPPDDGHRRRVYSNSMRATNPSMRRE